MMKKDAFIEDLKASERLWKEILSKYPDHKTRAEKLLEKGVREVGDGQIAFDIVLSCEALGEAERAESPEMMAEALGLAQHYGIKTELLDLTADKWTAAFFACAKYHADTDVYEPLLETEKEDEKGVMKEEETIVTPEVEKAFENLTKRIDVRWFTTVPYEN